MIRLNVEVQTTFTHNSVHQYNFRIDKLTCSIHQKELNFFWNNLNETRLQVIRIAPNIAICKIFNESFWIFWKVCVSQFWPKMRHIDLICFFIVTLIILGPSQPEGKKSKSINLFCWKCFKTLNLLDLKLISFKLNKLLFWGTENWKRVNY